MLRPSVLVLAFVLTSRAWWSALIDQQMSIVNALIWFLVAVPIAALVLAGLRSLTASYRRRDNPTPPSGPKRPTAPER